MARFDEAEQLFGQAVAIHRQIGNLNFVGTALVNLGAIALQREQWAKAHPLLLEGIAALDQAREFLMGAYGRLQLAIWHRRTGNDLAGAKTLLDRAQADLEGAANWPRYALVLCEMGHWLMASGQSGRAPFEAALALTARLPRNSKNELTRTLAHLDRTLRAFEAGATLVCGELVA
jgi:tetratricopeptide (TPR) repeat protein